MESNDRRHQEVAGIWLGRRDFGLSHVGKGLALVATIVGTVAGCFVWGLNMAGRRIVDVDADFKRQAIYNDSVSLAQRANIDARLSRVEMQISIVGLVQCTQISPAAPEWVKEECRAVLNQGRPR